MPPIKTVIYLDVLLLTNFALTLLFLLAAGLLAGVECRAGRLLLGGAAGAASSLALLAPEALLFCQALQAKNPHKNLC